MKTKIKSVLNWLKAYWYVPFLAILLILATILAQRGLANRVLELIKNARNSHKSEVGIIEDTHAEELRLKEENQKKYLETLEQLEEKYERRKEELSKAKKQKLKTIIEETNNDSKELSKRLAEEFDLNYRE